MNISQLLSQGHQLQNAGQLAEAQKLYREILAVYPHCPEAVYAMGLIAQKLGLADSAFELLLTASLIAPGNAEYRNSLGIILEGQSKFKEAAYCYRCALSLNPNYAEALCNMGNVQRRMRELENALAAYHECLVLRPEFAVGHLNISMLYSDMGQPQAAVAHAQKALALNLKVPETYNALGAALLEAKKFVQAESALRQALTIRPEYPEAWNNLGNAMWSLGRPDEAIAAYARTIQIRPEFTGAYGNLLRALKNTGRLPEALAGYRQALARFPDDAGMHSEYIFALQLDETVSPAQLRQEAEVFGKRHTPAEAPRSFNKPLGQRRIRVGYVSGDFREHVVGWNILPILEHHHRDEFEVFCYTRTYQSDATTLAIRGKLEHGRQIASLDPVKPADLIAADGIDILVDLAGHSDGRQLLIFAQKPAPIQITYLGYNGTTGLPAMDYRISDRFLDEPGTEANYTEKTLYMPHSHWCYRPGGEAPPIAPRPRDKNSFVTFGCLCAFFKVSPAAQRLWARILAQSPNSRLVMCVPPGQARDTVAQRFAALGVANQRLQFLGQQEWLPYMSNYNLIDIALDPFPYGGAITTCDALWMNVPVVTLAGKTSVGRAGKSILSNLGQPQWIAADHEQYIKIAVQLAEETGPRPDLRGMLRASPLMDAPRFTADLEACYREIVRN